MANRCDHRIETNLDYDRPGKSLKTGIDYSLYSNSARVFSTGKLSGWEINLVYLHVLYLKLKPEPALSML
jgi:hypothetical protein